MQISTHTPHVRRDKLCSAYGKIIWHFYSHASCEAWQKICKRRIWCRKFLLTRLMWGVTIGFNSPYRRVLFLLTRLMWGVTLFYVQLSNFDIISTHTPHVRRDKGVYLLDVKIGISTHTPHVRRDGWTHGLGIELKEISTHTPHVRRDIRVKKCKESIKNFYSHASCEAWHG